MAQVVPQQRTLVNVFIASPGDLSEERQRFRDAIHEVNLTKAGGLGIQLEALGWEDTLPGKGRPQALINRDIELCDLFVLLMWKRWGTPSGVYSSGTEEEFELARKLNECNRGRPDIWLYFRAVSDEMLADPGAQLSKVIEFRTRLEQARSFLYRTFDTPDSWERQFRQHLARWLDKLPPFERPPERIDVYSRAQERLQVSAARVGLSQAEGQTAQAKLAEAALVLRTQALEAARQGQFTQAEALFAASLATHELPETLNAYGLFLDGIGDTGKAEAIFQRLLQVAISAGDHSYLATAYGNLGHLYAKCKDLARAKEMWLRASDAVGADLSSMQDPDRPRPVQFYSCFISYSTSDQRFADRLHNDLQAHGVRCWFAPADLKIGEPFRSRIDESIRLLDKLLLILSAQSIGSAWVQSEVESAFDKERRQQRSVLFPIRLDDAVMETDEAWAADIRRTRHIGDFRHWQDDDAYRNALARLLRDLKADGMHEHEATVGRSLREDLGSRHPYDEAMETTVRAAIGKLTDIEVRFVRWLLRMNRPGQGQVQKQGFHEVPESIIGKTSGLLIEFESVRPGNGLVEMDRRYYINPRSEQAIKNVLYPPQR